MSERGVRLGFGGLTKREREVSPHGLVDPVSFHGASSVRSSVPVLCLSAYACAFRGERSDGEGKEKTEEQREANRKGG